MLLSDTEAERLVALAEHYRASLQTIATLNCDAATLASLARIGLNTAPPVYALQEPVAFPADQKLWALAILAEADRLAACATRLACLRRSLND